MANPAPPPPSSATTTAIVNSQYCAPYPVNLMVTEERTSAAKNFTVTDGNGNVVFRVKSPLATIVTPREHRFLRDPYGNTIVHLRKALNKDSWKAFRGESTEQRDLIFTRKRSYSQFQLRTKLNVFLANNSSKFCDFKVEASDLSERSWVVYLGETDTVVAQIEKKAGTIFSREKFMLTLSPNIDYAFIVALVVTLDD